MGEGAGTREMMSRLLLHKSVPLLKAALRPLADYALPPRCPGCGEIVDADHAFCLACWSGMRFLGEPCCARCGLPFEYDRGEGADCGACLEIGSASWRERGCHEVLFPAVGVTLKKKKDTK